MMSKYDVAPPIVCAYNISVEESKNMIVIGADGSAHSTCGQVQGGLARHANQQLNSIYLKH